MLKDTLKFLIQYILGGLGLALLLLLLFPGLRPAGLLTPAASGLTEQPATYSAAIRRIAPAVVNVYTTSLVERPVNPLLQDPLFRRFFGLPDPETQQQLDSSLGSGVILNYNHNGYILTNAHVINRATAIQITLSDGRQAQATPVGIDEETDLAVLRIDLKDLPVAPLGDSDRLRVGDVVLAIGNPYNFGQTVTQGIVSAMGRQRLGISAIEDFIQTDADINPGNSGGALINSEGRLVGINTAIYSQSGGSQGIGFAIPINLAVGVMRQLLEQGYVVRGWLGFEVQTLPRDIAEATRLDHGVLVSGVMRSGPAGKAGLNPGDILLSINGQDMGTPQQTIQTIARVKPGKSVKLEVLRGWDRISLDARVIQQPSYRR